MTAWDTLLSPLLLPKTCIKETISELRPLFTGTDECSTPIQLLHQSFRDFLRSRIPGHVPLTLKPAKDQKRLAFCCFQVINTGVGGVAELGVIERLGERDVLPKILHENIPEELDYACLFGLDHALEANDPSIDLKVEIVKFLEGSIINWLELCVRVRRYILISPFFHWIEVSGSILCWFYIT